MKEINASEFKAKCLAILDQVKQTGEPVTILKRGKPVAQLLPLLSRSQRYPQSDLKDSVTILEDLREPVLPPDTWDAEQGKL